MIRQESVQEHTPGLEKSKQHCGTHSSEANPSCDSITACLDPHNLLALGWYYQFGADITARVASFLYLSVDGGEEACSISA